MRKPFWKESHKSWHSEIGRQQQRPVKPLRPSRQVRAKD